MTDQQTFLLEEYKALRKELELSIQSMYTQEQYAFGAAGITWGWLITHGVTSLVFWCLPVLIMVVLYARMRNMSDEVYEMGLHLRRIEKLFRWQGWEHRFDLIKQRPVTWRTKLVDLWFFLYNNVLVLGGIAIAALAALFRSHLVLHVDPPKEGGIWHQTSCLVARSHWTG